MSSIRELVSAKIEMPVSFEMFADRLLAGLSGKPLPSAYFGISP